MAPFFSRDGPDNGEGIRRSQTVLTAYQLLEIACEILPRNPGESVKDVGSAASPPDARAPVRSQARAF